MPRPAPNFVASSKLLQKRWDDRAYEVHTKKVKRMKADIDNKPPKEFLHLQIRLKKMKQEEDRQATIKHENRILLAKMSHIMKTRGRVDNWNDQSSKSTLNQPYREKVVHKINQENAVILDKLKGVGPTYHTNKWEVDFQKHLYYLKCRDEATKDYRIDMKTNLQLRGGTLKEISKGKSRSVPNGQITSVDVKVKVPKPSNTSKQPNGQIKSMDAKEKVAKPAIGNKQHTNKVNTKNVTGRRDKLPPLKKITDDVEKDKVVSQKQADEVIENATEYIEKASETQTENKVDDGITETDNFNKEVTQTDSPEAKADSYQDDTFFDNASDDGAKDIVAGSEANVDVVTDVIDSTDNVIEVASEQDESEEMETKVENTSPIVVEDRTNEEDAVEERSQKEVENTSPIVVEDRTIEEDTEEERSQKEVEHTSSVVVEDITNEEDAVEERSQKEVENPEANNEEDNVSGTEVEQTNNEKDANTNDQSEKESSVQSDHEEASKDEEQSKGDNGSSANTADDLTVNEVKETEEQLGQEDDKKSNSSISTEDKDGKSSKLDEAEEQLDKEEDKKSNSSISKEDQDNSSSKSEAGDSTAFDPYEDAKVLNKALHELGTGSDTTINMLTIRTHDERIEIGKVYAAEYSEDLITETKVELGESYEEVLNALLMENFKYDAQTLFDAIEASENRDCILVEILCSRTELELEAITEFYESEYGLTLDASILDDVQTGMAKLFSRFVTIRRESNDNVDKSAIEEEVNELLQGDEKAWEGDDSKLNSILSKRSRAHIKELCKEFNEKSSAGDIFQVIDEKVSASVKDSIKSVIMCLTDVATHFADLAKKAIDNNDEQTISRIIVTRSETDLDEIEDAYRQKYDMQLPTAVENNITSSCKKLLLKMLY